MKNNKEFMEIYTAKKEPKEMRSLIYALIIISNVFNFLVFLFYQFILGKDISLTTNQQGVLDMLKNYFIIMIPYNLISLILYIFPKKLEFLMELYISITFVGSSILYFCISMLIFITELNISEAIIVIILSITIYIFLVLAIIRNIKNKMRNGLKKVNIDKRLVSVFTSFCIALGIIASKKTDPYFLTPAIVFLMLSYLLTPTIPGFHKFYLIVKEKRKL
ncbi:hypothetical protein [Clostridium celatum]|uniref:Uncharacterized protein n=1 Tax=Clostridium celatum DSM 1785 TaxID=545697 RepID=L1Q648_9CLOT|nr:hypothetical protein [Clostridium celatum]EKY23092.1 hypothetical protein HMPREF0216_03052 [Clostridium celatum DSM 1785]MCE9656873.1 hypothetical protein [Clostridium celatum]